LPFASCLLPIFTRKLILHDYLTLNGNATDESILQKAGIDKARVLATVLPDDALNVFITLTARELSPQLYIIARGEYPSTEKKLKLAGADQVVLPATIGAERMAHLITHPAAIDFLQEDEGRRNLNELLADIDMQFEEYSILRDSPFLGQPKYLSKINYTHLTTSCLLPLAFCLSSLGN
jgi:voltage-gated potassium channel